MVVASRGKQVRAKPITVYYEQHRVHHVGEFPTLEDQMTGWDPSANGPSPDRVDALVWALTDLMGARAPMRIDPSVIEHIRQNPSPGTTGWNQRYGLGRFRGG